MTEDIATNKVNDKLLYKQPQLSYVIKVVKLRHRFIFYAQDRTGYDFSTLYDLCINQPTQQLCDILRDYVTEPYKNLEAEISFDSRQYKEIFPKGSEIRYFYVMIRFKSRDKINKMKLKYPKLMDEIGVA